MNFNDPKESIDPQLFYDPKEISIGSMDFDNPKVYSDTSIFYGLVLSETLSYASFREILCGHFYGRSAKGRKEGNQ